MLDDELSTILTAARPPFDEAALRDTSVELARETVRTSRRARLRRRRRLVGAVAVVAVAVPGAAAASWWTTRTGEYGDPSSTEEDSSEWLDVCAPDYPEVAASLAPTARALPAGASWAVAIDSVVGGAETTCAEGPAVMQETGVRLTYEFFFGCAWGQAWLNAHDRGDRDAMSSSADRLREAAESPLVAANDGGGVVDSLTRVADAADRGKPGPVRDQVAANCAPEWVEGVQ